LTLLGALLWWGLVNSRTWLIDTRCANNPALCDAATVSSVDRYALSQDSSVADGWSYQTQNFSGIWAYAIPIGLQIGRIALQSQPVGLALSLIAQDALMVTETIVYNGALNEAARVIVQRPRPFVYGDPGYHGSDPHNYTSFYSGHTSFTASTSVALFFVMLARTSSAMALALIASGGFALVLSTGVLRILAGRHFFTDVLVGAIAGALVALVIAFLHRSPELGEPKEHGK
jgi:membrane-associated phospholipid phosphatase